MRSYKIALLIVLALSSFFAKYDAAAQGITLLSKNTPYTVPGNTNATYVAADSINDFIMIAWNSVVDNDAPEKHCIMAQCFKKFGNDVSPITKPFMATRLFKSQTSSLKILAYGGYFRLFWNGESKTNPINAYMNMYDLYGEQIINEKFLAIGYIEVIGNLLPPFKYGDFVVGIQVTYTTYYHFNPTTNSLSPYEPENIVLEDTIEQQDITSLGVTIIHQSIGVPMYRKNNGDTTMYYFNDSTKVKYRGMYYQDNSGLVVSLDDKYVKYYKTPFDAKPYKTLEHKLKYPLAISKGYDDNFYISCIGKNPDIFELSVLVNAYFQLYMIAPNDSISISGNRSSICGQYFWDGKHDIKGRIGDYKVTKRFAYNRFQAIIDIVYFHYGENKITTTFYIGKDGNLKNVSNFNTYEIGIRITTTMKDSTVQLCIFDNKFCLEVLRDKVKVYAKNNYPNLLNISNKLFVSFEQTLNTDSVLKLTKWDPEYNDVTDIDTISIKPKQDKNIFIKKLNKSYPYGKFFVSTCELQTTNDTTKRELNVVIPTETGWKIFTNNTIQTTNKSSNIKDFKLTSVYNPISNSYFNLLTYTGTPFIKPFYYSISGNKDVYKFDSGIIETNKLVPMIDLFYLDTNNYLIYDSSSKYLINSQIIANKYLFYFGSKYIQNINGEIIRTNLYDDHIFIKKTVLNKNDQSTKPYTIKTSDSQYIQTDFLVSSFCIVQNPNNRSFAVVYTNNSSDTVGGVYCFMLDKDYNKVGKEIRIKQHGQELNTNPTGVFINDSLYVAWSETLGEVMKIYGSSVGLLKDKTQSVDEDTKPKITKPELSLGTKE